jgi:hypothetical protein
MGNAGFLAGGPGSAGRAGRPWGLVPAGTVFAFLTEHRQELSDDSFAADSFPSQTGRPSLPTNMIGSVLVLQAYALSGHRPRTP